MTSNLGGSMDDDDFWAIEPEDADETTFAQGRLPERTYVSRTFTIDRPNSGDVGQPARFVYKVFDPDGESSARFDGAEWLVNQTEKGRYQVKLLVARESGYVKELWIQRVPASGDQAKTRTLLNLRRPEVARLIELLRNLEHIPIHGETGVRVDDALVRELFADPVALVRIYNEGPERFRQLISDDEAAKDVVAIAHRRAQVEEFRRLLDDDSHFDQQTAAVPGRRPEAVWQRFFEANPWMLGVTLAGQLLTSWSPTRLEQVVAGRSISGVGKRADALLRTSGRIRSMVFAEFKTHRTKLLHEEYRSGCWSPSRELVGGVAQVQGTVHRAVDDIGERLADVGPDGGEMPGAFTYLIRPRSYLIVGRLTELLGEAGGHHSDRIRSFELYRRHLDEPEVVTFDELLARAEWFVNAAES